MKLSRRNLFGLAGGAAAAVVLPKVAEAVKTEPIMVLNSPMDEAVSCSVYDYGYASAPTYFSVAGSFTTIDPYWPK